MDLPARRPAAPAPPWCILLLASAWLACSPLSAAQTRRDGGEAACAGLRGGRTLLYENPQWGLALTYPSVFTLDFRSIPDNADTAQFRAADPRVQAIVTALRNGAGQSLAELRVEAERDIRENSHGSITYQRVTPDWFVISGFIGDRIYYRRSLLARGGTVIATLWIEFPREFRSCLEAAVATMSLSFRPLTP